MDPDQNKDPNYQPAFNNPDYWNNTSGQGNTQNTNSNSPNQPNTPPIPVTQTPMQPANTPSSILEPKPTSSSYSPPAPKPSGSSNGLMIIMVVLVIVLLGATGLFAFQNYQLRQQYASPVASATPVTKALATPDPTANWILYTDKNNKYSFKYPSDWEIITATDAGKPKDLFIATDKMETQKYLKANPGGFDLRSRVDTTVGGVNITRFTSKGVYQWESAVIPLGTGTLIIEGVLNNNPSADEVQLFNQIISTFKLTAQSGASLYPSASPSASPISNACGTGWKLFDNKAIQFCYPDTLKETAASTASAIVMDDTTQTLKVTQNFQGGWGGSPCLFIDKTTVSGYASKRLSWKKENADGTCQNIYTSFAEMVNEGNFTFPFPYAVELTSKKTPYPDNTAFLTIEKSFKVTSTGTQAK